MAEATHPHPRRTRRTAVTVVVVALIVVIGAAAWLGVRGWLAKAELEQIQSAKADLSQAVGAHDVDAVSAALASVHAHAERAADLTVDPIWRATEGLPLLGANTAAVRVSAESMRDLTASALPLVGMMAADHAASTPGLDLSSLGDLAAPLRTVADAAATAQAQLAAVRLDALLPPLREGVGELQTLVDDAAPLLDQAATAITIAPGMFGAGGDRTLLVMVQNTAEVRTGGGVTGSFIAVHAAGGHLSIGEHADSTEFRRGAVTSVPLPAELTAMYGPNVGDYVTNITVTPDFDLSARLASAWWQTLGRTAPDTVISIDPAVLSALLQITGPLTLSDGTTVDAGTVNNEILVRPYLEQTQTGQTLIQTDLTQRLFDRLLVTPFDATRWAAALAAPVADGRVSVWSAHADEEAVLAAGPFGGTLARVRHGGPDTVGVYFNDVTTGKMDSFVDTTIDVSSRVCRADGVAEVAVSVTLVNTATGTARAFPASMTGAANPSLPGDVTTDVTVTAPSGWFLGGVQQGGAAVPSTDVDADGEGPSSVARVLLAPGQSTTTIFHLLVGEGGSPPSPTIVHTPMMNPVTLESTAAGPCG